MKLFLRLAGAGIFVSSIMAGALLVSCGGPKQAASAGADEDDASPPDDASVVDGVADGDVAPLDSAPPPADASVDAYDSGGNPCTSTFGTALTTAFGRFDGTLFAIVRPQDQQCPRPNSSHIVLEVSMKGAIYRILVRVLSDQVLDPRVQLVEKDIALPEGPWSEGWHTGGAPIDYATTFGLHAADFTPYAKDDLVDKIVSMLKIGDALSIYANGYGADGAHEVHRNGSGDDGVLILHPASPGATPHALMFHFINQDF